MILTINGRDVAGVAPWEATVQAGRDGLDSQPDASVMEAGIHGWREAGQLNDPVTLSDDVGVLFHGVITDLSAELDAVEHRWVTRFVAVGPLSGVGRVIIGDVPWPAESDSARVARILDLAGAAHAVNPNVNGPLMLPTDVDRKPALELAHSVAADALGVLWEQPADTVTPIRYAPQRLRAWQPVAPAWSELPAGQSWAELPPEMTWGDWTTEHYGGELTTPSLTLDAGRVVADVQLTQRIGDLVRKVRITYGPEPVEGDRPQAVAGEGSPELSLDTRLADQAGAEAVADSLWRARREPAWRLTSARVRLSELPPGERATIRAALAVGTKLTLTGIGFDGPLGTQWQGYIEGWTHGLAGGAHDLILNLVDRRLVEPSNRWQDVPADLEWQDIDPALTWADTVGGFT